MTFHPRTLVAVVVLLTGSSTVALAEEVKVPVETSEKGTVYVAPIVNPTETSATTSGATVGVERKDGGGVKAGVETSGERPTYSVGGSTGGNTSFSAGAHSDGKANTGVKAGITIKY